MNPPIAGKMTASSHVTAQESLPEKRQDGLEPENTAHKRKGDTDNCLRTACGKPFVLKRSNQKHCCEACRKLHYRETHFVRIVP